MTSNFSNGRTLAEILSSVPPVPPEVLATVAKTGYGQRHGSWATYKWNDIHSWNIAQMVTALILIEQSPAGKEWGVRLDAIPSNIRAASDARFSAACTGGILTEVFAYVEWFFLKSRLSEDAPGATVRWDDPEPITSVKHPGISFSCNAIRKMLYAAQELLSHDTAEVSIRLTSMETRMRELEANNSSLDSQLQQVTLKLHQVSSELQQVTSHIRNRPTVTCLMHLFAGYTDFGYTICDPAVTNSAEIDTVLTSDSVNVKISPHLPATRIATNPTFKIAPHTDRLSNLSPDAQDWFLNQLDTRTVWVRATEPDSYDNHISWTQFSGAVEMSRKTIVFSYGNYRFW